MILKQYGINTGAEGFYDISEQVRAALIESGIREGLCVVYCPHTTAAITINENADPDVVDDMLLGLRKAFPDRAEFKHAEGNSSAHLKSSTIGSSVSVLISQGRLVLGTWQGIYFCEFDGPRTRKFFVRVSA